MRALTLDADGSAHRWITRTPLAETSAERNEAWLQALLHDNPDLIPMDAICPGTGPYLPVCRELAIPKAGSPVFLDLFGVTPQGKPVLIECKLWRNPQARREVIAQALEYASLIRQWSYGDLSARLKSKLGSDGDNPLYDAVADFDGVTDEAAFVDNVSACLKAGDFILIIAGDGIRSDVQAIADHLNDGGSTARLALLEFQLFEDETGILTIIPSVPMRTEVLTQRVILSNDGSPLEITSENASDAATEATIDPERQQRREAVRAFWQGFIDEANFDHPDQPKPRHGGTGWVKIPLPEPVGWITAYTAKKDGAGLFVTLRGEEGRSLFSDLQASSDQISDEIGEKLIFKEETQEPFKGSISFGSPDASEPKLLLAWFLVTSNRAVSALRTFISQYRTSV